MSKLDNIEYFDKKTGEEYNLDVVKSILEEEKQNKINYVKWKIKNNPYEMTIDELELYRAIMHKPKNISLRYESGTFFTACRIEEAISKNINLDTLGILWLVSGLVNKNGVLIYKGNNKPISSFEKLRELLNIGSTKWNKIKKDIDLYKLIIKISTRDNRNVLVLNPMYSYISTEIGEIRFIAYGDILKEFLEFEDYLLLCLKYSIVPEF